MNNTVNKYFGFPLFLIILSILNLNCTSLEYEKYTLEKEDVRFKISEITSKHPRFSFEYPRSFNLIDLNKSYHIVDYGDNVTHVGFTRKESGRRIESGLFVAIFEHEPDKYNLMPLITLDWVLTKSSGKSIVEEKDITVAEIPAKYYKCWLQVDNSLNLYLISYFEYLGFKWEICLLTYQENEDELTVEFERIIETFHFIE